VQKFKSQIAFTLRNGKAFGIVIFCSLFFALAGPFGSFSALSVADRLLFWAPVVGVAFVIVAISHAIVVHLLKVKDLIRQRMMTYLMFCTVFSPLLYGFILSGPVTWSGEDVSFAILSSWGSASVISRVLRLMGGANCWN